MMAAELNWVDCVLEDIGNVVTGKTPSTKDTANFGGTIPFVKPGDLNFGGYVTFTADTLTEKGFNLVPRLPKNAIMVTCIGNLGKVGITSMPSATNQQINSVVPHQLINSKYLYYFLLTIQSWLERESSATTVSIINKGKFSKAPIKLPPLAEQQQIAAKLDELLAQVDNLKTRLDNIPKILKRFRQSVLAAAVSGKLTEDWREKMDDFEPVEMINWKWIAVPSDWKVLYYSDLVQSRLGKMLDKAKNTGTPTHYLGNINVRWLNFDLSNLQEILVSDKEQIELTVKIGDVLICEGGEPGRCAIWNIELEQPIIFQKALHNARVGKKIIPAWLVYNLKNDCENKSIEQLFTGTTIKHLTGKALKKYPLRVPPLEEQTEIVARVEQLFAYADQIEQRVKDAQSRVNHLTQAILAKAFRGELTAEWRAQNPELISGENSAEALLARIKAEREQTQAVKKAKAIPSN